MKRWKAIALALALCIGITGGAWAQQQDRNRGLWDLQRGTTNGRDNRGQWGWQQDRDNDHDNDRDHDRDRDRDRRERDRKHNRGSWGWQNGRDNDHDRDDGYRNRPYYPNGAYGYPNGAYGRGNYGYNQAYQIGYQDGLNQGRSDFFARHNFQPEKAHNYKSADRGYNSSFGDKNSYRSAYRDAYLQGYRQGYGR